MEIASGDASGEEMRANLIADPLLTSLLVLHGIHPLDTRTRIERVLDDVRESLGPDALAPAFVSLDADSVLHLRLEGKGPRRGLDGGRGPKCGRAGRCGGRAGGCEHRIRRRSRRRRGIRPAGAN